MDELNTNKYRACVPLLDDDARPVVMELLDLIDHLRAETETLRRKPTANDRAVERILAEDEAQGSGRLVDRYTQGYGDGVERCAEIIREEAERHE